MSDNQKGGASTEVTFYILLSFSEAVVEFTKEKKGPLL